MKLINNIVVVGAGTMGSGIAAHLANADCKVHLLDLPSKISRNDITAKALENIKKSDPPLLYHKEKIKNITIGNLEDDFDIISEADWIIEAIVERVDVKHSLYEKFSVKRKKNSIISSNTSTIPLKILTEKLPIETKKDFCITHFFNPVRYMRLLEIVEDCKFKNPKIEKLKIFCQEILGKGIVNCKDTLGFIGNRVGVYSIQCAMYEAINKKIPIEKADAIFGRPLGIPKTGVFGLYDLIGIDLMKDVLKSFEKGLKKNDSFYEYVKLHDVAENLLKKGFKGNKTGCGFYKTNFSKIANPTKVLNYSKGIYYDYSKVDIKILTDAEKLGSKALLDDDSIYGEYAFKVFSKTILYCCEILNEISNNIVEIDNALKWGFNWYKGPFEMLHDYGVERFYQRCFDRNEKIPIYLEELKNKKISCYDNNTKSFIDTKFKKIFINTPKNTYRLCDIKRTSHPVFSNESASTWLINHNKSDVLCVEFHTKANALDGKAIDLLNETLSQVKSKGAVGVSVYNEAMNFSAGADLKTFLNFAEQKSWTEIDKYLKSFQETCLLMKYSNFPVVSAVSGLAIGGGFEVACQADKMIAHMNSTLGLVETSVGLIPAGGGCKELLWRWVQDKNFDDKDEAAVKAFNIVGYGLTSSSPIQACDHKFFLKNYDITANNKDELLFNSCSIIDEMSKNYQSKIEPKFCLSGYKIKNKMGEILEELKDKKIITEYEVQVGLHLAHVMSGGNTDKSKVLSERDILKLERESFINLISNVKTKDRIRSMLIEGKRLKN